MLPKDQELAQLQIKPETITNFKVGAKKKARSSPSTTTFSSALETSNSACTPTAPATP